MSTAFDALTDALRDAGRTVIVNSDGKATAQCPAHDDTQASLSIGTRRDGEGVVVYCHAGCDYTDVLAALNLTPADLFDESRMRQAFNPTRDYRYPGGRIAHRRRDANGRKTFRQTGNKTDRSLYGANLITPDTNPVYVAEGEKDCDAITATGAVAVCSAMGAGKASKADWSPVFGHHVVVIADNDDPGGRHADDIAGLLAGRVSSLRIVRAAVGKDAADHIAAGYGMTELVAADAPEPPAMRLWPAADLKPATQPRWLARGRLQRGATNLLVGDEGIGKSLLWVLIVAAITTGKPLPGFGIPHRDPGRVVLVCTEDDWCSTVRPRLEVTGADLSMIAVICTDDDGSGAPTFPRDIGLLREPPAPALVVVDAWLDTVPPALRVKDPQDARLALHPWKELATATDAAVLLLVHTNRLGSASARDRYGASYALRQKARMTLYAQSDDAGRLVVGPEKMNNAAPVPASLFAITTVRKFTPTDDDDGTVPLLVYAGESDRTARQHVADSFENDRSSEDVADRDNARTWLAGYIEVNGPAVLSAEAKRDAAKAGFSERTLQRARQELNVVFGWVGNPPKTTWSLPAPCIGGTAGKVGTAAGQDAMPRCASGTALAQGGDQQKHPQNGPAVPGVPNTGGVAQLDDPRCRVCGAELVHPTDIEAGLCQDCWVIANTTTANREDTTA